MAYSQFATISATTLPTATLPPGPSWQTPTIGAVSVTLRWTTVPGATGYVIEMREGSGPWGQVYSGTNTQFTQIGLVPGTEYEFRIKAVSAAGDSEWETIAVKTGEYSEYTSIIRLTNATACTLEQEGFITGG
ncbi:MAG: fibronectin type III domain-containing protein [Planctomycetaceae bacterium]|nr:fibronectin type III domain-containing protein [Planctomycetaceae bacterium]